jgi:hypothetical protein
VPVFFSYSATNSLSAKFKSDAAAIVMSSLNAREGKTNPNQTAPVTKAVHMTRKKAAFPLNQFMNIPPSSNYIYQIKIAVLFSDNNGLRKYTITVIAAFGNKQIPAL